MISVFEAGRDFGTDKSATLKEFYAVSLNKVGRLDDSISVLNELTSDDNARTGEVAGILGKVHKLQSERATDPAEKIEYMQKSVNALRDGFYQTYEYYPGINLVYNQIELANMRDDPSLIAQAFDDAELVMYSTKKAGAENTSDYWAAATLLEASVFAGEVTPQTVEKCLATSKHDWELESTLGNLRKVAETIGEQLKSNNIDETTTERLSKVRNLIIGDDNQIGVIYRQSKKVNAVHVTEDGLQAGEYEGLGVRWGKETFKNDDGSVESYEGWLIDTYVMKGDGEDRKSVYETTRRLKPGEWIVTNPKRYETDADNNYAMSDDEFQKIYHATEKDGIYASSGKLVRMFQNDTGKEVEFDGPWGRESGDEECFFATPYNPENPGEITNKRYAISANDVGLSYEKVEEVGENKI